ncbi:MAG TPA: HAD-IA family hydrolase, partial [Sphingomicrobium sp.]
MASSLSELGAGCWDATVCEQFALRFAHIRDELLHVAPCAFQALADLRARGIRMALVTNESADLQRQKPRRFNLDPYFAHLQIERERGFGKLNPQAYLEALTALGVTVPQAWIVSDDLERDVAAPQRLGILGVWRDR